MRIRMDPELFPKSGLGITGTVLFRIRNSKNSLLDPVPEKIIPDPKKWIKDRKKFRKRSAPVPHI